MAESIDLNPRITKLRDALEKAKSYPEGTTLEARPMADCLGVQWTTLKDWIAEIRGFIGNDCVVRGGQGIAWRFKPVETVQVILSHFESEIAERTGSNEQEYKDRNWDVPKSELARPLSEIRAMQVITSKGIDDKIRQGGYYVADEYDKDLAEIFSAFGNRLYNAPTYVDPTGLMHPETLEALKDYLRSLAGDCFKEAEEITERANARYERARNWRSD